MLLWLKATAAVQLMQFLFLQHSHYPFLSHTFFVCTSGFHFLCTPPMAPPSSRSGRVNGCVVTGTADGPFVASTSSLPRIDGGRRERGCGGRGKVVTVRVECDAIGALQHVWRDGRFATRSRRFSKEDQEKPMGVYMHVHGHG